jgi:2-methylcitrate dehydratase PrpD
MALSVFGRGNGYRTHRDFLEGWLALTPDSNVIRLSHVVTLSVDRELDERYPLTFAAGQTVRYRDGTSERVPRHRAKGWPDTPFTCEEHLVKLDELTDG